MQEFMGCSQPNPSKYSEAEARKLLADAGIPEPKWSVITRMGHGRGFASKPEDTVLNKLMGGALSMIGVCGVLYGTDSPQHHQGHNWMSPVRDLTCCCCGSATTGRQWFNRDTGYGLCNNCIGYVSRNEDDDGIRECYGVRGIHYAIGQDSQKVSA